MGLLPEIDLEQAAQQTSMEEPERPTGYLTPLFDFEKGEFVTDRNGRIVEDDGLRGMQTIINKAHYTARCAYEIYSEDYGTDEFDALVDPAPEDVRQIRIKEAIRDCLIYDDRIVEVGEIDLQRTTDGYMAIYEIETIFGTFPVRRTVK
ncbi:DUF2634 domain-containing protein [Aneurinibacillus aneurinilyticus]|uniref:DUF2634 domain-containing protein n=1 Tax=Aneurinibacillus aneurinilyticus TaxID=1391 RepID=UPI00352484DB